jgi:hypothetical protein
LTDYFPLVFRQSGMYGIYAEECQVGLQLYDEIGQDGAFCISVYGERINQVKQENADYRKEHFIKCPVFCMEHFVSEQ